MNQFERLRLLNAVILVAMALFVASGFRPMQHWRRPLRIAAIGALAVAVIAAAAESALWLWTGGWE